MFGNRKILGLVAGLVAAVTSGCAWGQGAPLEITRHADFYARIKVAGFTAPVELRQSGQRNRIDLVVGGVTQSYITDRDKGVLIALTTSGTSKLALVFPLDRADAIVPLPLDLSVMTRTAAVKPVGAALIGGRSCRLMEFSGYLNQAGMICVNSDNIILQMTKQGRNEPLFQVTDLTMGPQPPQWFRTPPDYVVAVVPGIGGASAPVAGPAPAPMIEPGPPADAIQPIR